MMHSSQSIGSSFASYSPTKQYVSMPLNAMQNYLPLIICTGAAQGNTLIRYHQISKKVSRL